MIEFNKIIEVLEKQNLPGYDIRIDFLQSLYFYSSLLPENAEIVELGTLYGCSLVTIAAALKGAWTLHGIDPALGGTFHYGDQHQSNGYTFTSSKQRVLQLINECGIENFPDEDGIINLLANKSWDIFELWNKSGYAPFLDMVFIDGEHTEEAIKKDLQWGSLVKSGGYLIIDDFFYEIAKTTEEFIQREDCWKMLHDSRTPPKDNWIITILQKSQ